MATSTVGSVQYDASINLASLRASLKQADKLVEQSYQKQSTNAQKASKATNTVVNKDTTERINAIKREASETAATISKYTPQIQRQFLTVERANLSVANATRSATNAVQRYGEGSLQAETAVKRLNIAVQSQSQAQTKLNGMLDGSIKSGSNFSGVMTKAGAVAGAVGAAIATAFKAALNAVSSLTSQMTQLYDASVKFPKVLTAMGATQEFANQQFQELKTYADETVYSLEDMTKTFGALYGITGDGTKELVLALGGISSLAANTRQAMDSYSLQLTQMVAKPTVAWQDFRILLEQNPAAIAKIAQAMGKSTSQLVKDVQDGSVATEDFLDTLKEVGNDPALQEAARSSDTFANATGQLEAAIASAGAEFLKTFGPEILKGINAFSEAIQSEPVKNAVNALAEGFKFLKDAIGFVIEQLQPLINYVKNNTQVIEVLKTTLLVLGGLLVGAVLAAIIIVVAAVTALTFVIDILIKAFTFVMEAGINAWNGIVGAWNGAVGFFTGIVNGIQNAFNGLIGFFSSLWGTITSMFRNVGVAIGNAISSAFKGVMNGVIGFVESTVNDIANSINRVAKGIDDVLPGDQSGFRVPNVRLPRFADGGFTGQGGKYQPAGIVHAGEYVIPKEGVDQSTGLPKSGAMGGTTNLTLNLGGMYFSSKSDKRAFATEIGKLINEASMSKLGKISIEGV